MRAASFMVVATLLLLGLCEWGIGKFLPYDREELIYHVLEQSPDYLWKVRGHLNLDFFGAPLVTDESGLRKRGFDSSCRKKIGVFGASPSFGWGVRESETYTDKLDLHFSPKGICFRNYSQIGFSSTQGKRLFAQVLETEKLDGAIIAYMVNDLDFIRFFDEDNRSDEEVFNQEKSPAPGVLKKFLLESNFVRLAGRVSRQMNSSLPSLKVIESYPGKRRVEDKELMDNHQKILELARKHQVKLFYLRLPIGLDWFYRKHAKTCEQFFHWKEGQSYKEALEELGEDSLAAFSAACPDHPLTSFRALYRHLKGEDKESDVVALKANFERGSAIYAMASLEDYDRELLNFLKSNNIAHVKMNLPQSKEELEEFFLSKHKDFVHPSAAGHDIIFKTLKTELNEFLNL